MHWQLSRVMDQMARTAVHYRCVESADEWALARFPAARRFLWTTVLRSGIDDEELQSELRIIITLDGNLFELAKVGHFVQSE